MSEQMEELLSELRSGTINFDDKAAQLIDQYAYEYAERVIGEDRDYEKYGECPNGCGMQYGCRCDSAEVRIKTEQRERNKELSPHRATKDGEGEV